MKILITGVSGQLGHDAVTEAFNRGHTIIGTDINVPVSFPAEFISADITDQQRIHELILNCKPDAVIHCAAWTDVDAAEDHQETVDLINHIGTRNIAEAAKASDAKMMYISTDYVFDGSGERPWQPEDRNCAPLNVYGESKLAGEQAVTGNTERFFIVRIAWAFGLNGKNFIKTIINAGRTHPAVRVVDDQIGTPTYTKDLARLLIDMIETDRYGFYHATNEGGYLSWADLAEEAFSAAGMDVRVDRITTAEYGLNKARRPGNSRLDKSKLRKAGFEPLPEWRDAVRRYIEEAGLKENGSDNS